MKLQPTLPVRKAAHLMLLLSLLSAAGASAQTATTHEKTAALPFPVVTRFENFGEKDGLPSHKVHCVLKTGDGKLWIGTTNGLCVRETDGRFRRYGPEDGLSHPVVLSMAEDPRTGDLWIATLQGLNRFSGGKITVFTQTNSGLPNNVVYGVAVIDDTVWAATPAGAGAYHIRTKTWKIFDQNNADMEEPWCYSIAPGDGVVYIGIWAGGIVEYDPRTGSFKAYRDPDGDFQFQLTPNSGPVADITSWIAYQEGILWQGTYFGLSRYDTKDATWQTWVQDKTPLVSNFINTLYARHRVAWIATDRGVSVTDGTNWVNYLVGENGQGVVRTYRPGQEPQTRTMTTALADGFVMAVWADDHEAWFATSNGLSHGIFGEPAGSPTVASNP
ncbi:MAG: two-component regulator propeller domain-containing protein [Opitutaceae bacterium]